MATQSTRRACTNAFLVLAVSMLSACATPQYWWTYQNNVEHTGGSAGVGRAPALLWDITLGGGSDLTPPVFGAIGDTFRLFLGTGYGDRSLYALSPYNGTTLWKFTAPMNNGFMGAPVAVNNHVFAATLGLTPHVYALEQPTGAVVWQTPLPSTGSRASIAMAVALGRVFVNTDAHQLLALNALSGAILWSANTSPGATSQESSPAVGINKVYVGSDDGLYAFEIATGALAWKYTLPTAVGFSSPVLVSSGAAVPLVLISTVDRKVHAVNANTGVGVWTYTSNVSLADTSLAFADGRVFTRDLSGAVALDVNSGAVLWTSPFGISRKSPAIARGVVFYADDDTVYGLDTATGALTWKAQIPGGTVAGADMAIALEILIVPNHGRVYAFR